MAGEHITFQGNESFHRELVSFRKAAPSKLSQDIKVLPPIYRSSSSKTNQKWILLQKHIETSIIIEQNNNLFYFQQEEKILY